MIDDPIVTILSADEGFVSKRCTCKPWFVGRNDWGYKVGCTRNPRVRHSSFKYDTYGAIGWMLRTIVWMLRAIVRMLRAILWMPRFVQAYNFDWGGKGREGRRSGLASLRSALITCIPGNAVS
eukprot:288031-Prorocentrum_minimum.AAC.1